MVIRSKKGFTLLEVMVSVAIISIALVTLIGSQSQSVSLAGISRFDVDASLLAREKMAELTMVDVADLQADSGDFEGQYQGYQWQVEVETVGGEETGIVGVDGLLKRATVTVFVEDGERFHLHTIFMGPMESREKK